MLGNSTHAAVATVFAITAMPSLVCFRANKRMGPFDERSAFDENAPVLSQAHVHSDCGCNMPFGPF